MAKNFFLSVINEKTSISEKGGIGSVFKSTEEQTKVIKPVTPSTDPDETNELRQSFIVMSDDLDKLKDYVYFKKVEGDPSFSQKEALHLALKLLFDQEKNIPQRLEKVKHQELIP